MTTRAQRSRGAPFARTTGRYSRPVVSTSTAGTTRSASGTSRCCPSTATAASGRRCCTRLQSEAAAAGKPRLRASRFRLRQGYGGQDGGQAAAHSCRAFQSRAAALRAARVSADRRSRVICSWSGGGRETDKGKGRREKGENGSVVVPSPFYLFLVPARRRLREYRLVTILLPSWPIGSHRKPMTP